MEDARGPSLTPLLVTRACLLILAGALVVATVPAVCATAQHALEPSGTANGSADSPTGGECLDGSLVSLGRSIDE